MDSPQTFTRESFKLLKSRFCPETRAIPLTLSRTTTTKRPNGHKVFISGRSLFQRQSLVLPGVPSSGKGLDTAQQSSPGAPATHQIQMIKNQGWFVHLTQDQQHFIVYKFLEFLQVAVHVFLQLVSDLQSKHKGWHWNLGVQQKHLWALPCRTLFTFSLKTATGTQPSGDQASQYVASLQFSQNGLCGKRA